MASSPPAEAREAVWQVIQNINHSWLSGRPERGRPVAAPRSDFRHA